MALAQLTRLLTLLSYLAVSHHGDASNAVVGP